MTVGSDDNLAENLVTPADTVAPETVAEYLERHPEFFRQRPELLAAMEPPDRYGSEDAVVDFQRFQIDRRNDELDELRNCAQEVIETSRTNMTIQTRTHAAVVAMMHAREFEQLARIVVDDLPLMLDVDVVSFGFEPAIPPVPALVSGHVRLLPMNTVDMIVGGDQDVSLYKDFMDDGTVFGAAASLVQSAACARIKPGVHMPAGMLALGSRGMVFQPGQGTELISFMARVVEACTMRVLER